MEVGDVRDRRQAVSGKIDVWIERHAPDEEPAPPVLVHDADGAILITINDKAALRRKRKEEQHVAARQGRDEGFLRIDRISARQRQRHDAGRCRSWHLHPSIKSPNVPAAVAVILKSRPVTDPTDGRCVFHGRSQLMLFTKSWYCSSL